MMHQSLCFPFPEGPTFETGTLQNAEPGFPGLRGEQGPKGNPGLKGMKGDFLFLVPLGFCVPLKSLQKTFWGMSKLTALGT